MGPMCSSVVVLVVKYWNMTLQVGKELMLSAIWIPCHTPASPETPTLHIPAIQHFKGYPRAKEEAWGTLRFHYCS